MNAGANHPLVRQSMGILKNHQIELWLRSLEKLDPVLGKALRMVPIQTEDNTTLIIELPSASPSSPNSRV